MEQCREVRPSEWVLESPRGDRLRTQEMPGMQRWVGMAEQWMRKHVRPEMVECQLTRR